VPEESAKRRKADLRVIGQQVSEVPEADMLCRQIAFQLSGRSHPRDV